MRAQQEFGPRGSDCHSVVKCHSQLVIVKKLDCRLVHQQMDFWGLVVIYFLNNYSSGVKRQLMLSYRALPTSCAAPERSDKKKKKREN